MLADIFFPKHGFLNIQPYYISAPLLFPSILYTRKHNIPYIRNIWYITHYNHPEIQNTFIKIKLSYQYDRLNEIAESLAKAYNNFISSQGYTHDLITPVSDNIFRMNTRGFSVVRSFTTYFPQYLIHHIFVPTKDKYEMAQLSKYMRKQQKPVLGLASLPLFQPKHILLLDDIITTGTTLSQHAKLLQQSYPQATIDVLVFASSEKSYPQVKKTL